MAVTFVDISTSPSRSRTRSARRVADLAIVDDAGLGNVDRTDAGGMRLELGQAVLVDLRAVDAVGLAALVNPLEGRQLAVVDGDDHLAADLVRDPLGLRKTPPSPSCRPGS